MEGEPYVQFLQKECEQKWCLSPPLSLSAFIGWKSKISRSQEMVWPEDDRSLWP